MSYQGSVLVVDDEIGPRESLRMILRPLYEVHTASDGQEALKCIQNQPIDLVTLDLRMPGLSGMDVLKEIKKYNAEIDVIMISAYGTKKDVQEAQTHGALGFIQKPFNAAEVVASIGKSVEQKKYKQKVKSLVETVKSLGFIKEDEIDKILYN